MAIVGAAALMASCGGAGEDGGLANGIIPTSVVALTLPVESTVVSTTIDPAAPAPLTEDALIQLQLDCVYSGNAAACDSLVLAGYPSAGNYGLGNSLTQAPDADLVAKCNGGWRLMCAELLARYPQTNGVPPAPDDDTPDVPSLTDEELVNLRLDCVYRGAGTACDALVAAGYTPDDNYGLTNLYNQAPEELAVAACAKKDRLACAELAYRYPSVAGDDAVAASFVSALIAGQPLDGLASSYVITAVSGTPVAVASLDVASYNFDTNGGSFSFSLSPATKWECHAGVGLVRSCTYFAG